MKNILMKIDSLRKDYYGMSVVCLCRKAGITPQTYFNAMRDGHCSERILKRMADVFGLEPIKGEWKWR